MFDFSTQILIVKQRKKVDFSKHFDSEKLYLRQ